MKLTTAIIILLPIFITGCVSHNSERRSPDKESITSVSPGGILLIGFNRNDDYEIDETEFNAGRISAFIKADLNGDGVIDIAEFRYWQPKANGSRSALPKLAYFDKNFDDQVTQVEFDTGLVNIFNNADENRDNKVSYEELVTIKSPPEAQKRRGLSGSDSGDRRRGGRGNSRNF